MTPEFESWQEGMGLMPFGRSAETDNAPGERFNLKRSMKHAYTTWKVIHGIALANSVTKETYQEISLADGSVLSITQPKDSLEYFGIEYSFISFASNHDPDQNFCALYSVVDNEWRCEFSFGNSTDLTHIDTHSGEFMEQSFGQIKQTFDKIHSILQEANL